MSRCVTPVDRFTVLFLFGFGHGRSITQQNPPLFSFRRGFFLFFFYVYIRSQAPFPEQRFMLSPSGCTSGIDFIKGFGVFFSELFGLESHSVQEVVKHQFTQSGRFMSIDAFSEKAEERQSQQR